MAHETLQHNPFMMMMNPEVVLAAMERSERLSRLNRRLCRPLDRQVVGSTPADAGPGALSSDGADDDGHGDGGCGGD
jgi:hypothetical protein